MSNFIKDSVNIKDMSQVKKIAEINMALLTGQDTSKYGKDVDKTVNFMSDLSSQAINSSRAKSELNTILRIGIDPLLVKQTSVYKMFGNYKSIGMDETPVVHTYTYDDIDANIQAKGSDVTFGDRKEVNYTIPTETISAGMKYNYREAESKDFAGTNAQEIEQIMTTMHNKGVKYVHDVIVNAVKNNSTGVKFYSAYTGTPTKAVVDAMIAKIRRMGKVSILGDYSNIAAISDFNGHHEVSSTELPFYTPMQVEEIAKQGYNGWYNGSDLFVLPNGYNYTKPKADKSEFETYYDTDAIFFVPQGINSPVNIIKRGGLTSFSANNVSTGDIETRFDMEIGADVVKGREFEIGLLTK